MDSSISKDILDTFQIIFRDFCPYCFSRTEGLHLCPGTQKAINMIDKNYNGWRHNGNKAGDNTNVDADISPTG